MIAPDTSGAPRPDRSRTSPRMPAESCDCHVHVLDPERFPFKQNRSYTPGHATVEQLAQFHRKLGVSRTVVVQNSVYGTDNSCLLDALRQLGTHARGIAVVPDNVSDTELQTLHDAGVRGLRTNLSITETADVTPAARLLAMASRLPSNWHIEVNAPSSALATLTDSIARCARPVVLDHFAHADAALGSSQAGLSSILELLKGRRVFVKLSAPYQISHDPLYADVATIARAYIAAAPQQLIWGSDWPHTGGAPRLKDSNPSATEPFRQVDDIRNLGLLFDWTQDFETAEIILSSTPKSLYDFTAHERSAGM